MNHELNEKYFYKLKQVGLSDYYAYKILAMGMNVRFITRIVAIFPIIVVGALAVMFLFSMPIFNMVADYIEIAPVLNAKATPNWQYDQNVFIENSYPDSTINVWTSFEEFTGSDYQKELPMTFTEEDIDIENDGTQITVGEDIKPGIYTLDLSEIYGIEIEDQTGHTASLYPQNYGYFVNVPLMDGMTIKTACRNNVYTSSETCNFKALAQDEYVMYDEAVQIPGIYIYGKSNMNDSTTLNTRDYTLYIPHKGRFEDYHGTNLNDSTDGNFYFDDRVNTDAFDTEFTFNNVPGSVLILENAKNAQTNPLE